MNVMFNYLRNLNGYDFSALLLVLTTIDVWAANYASSKIRGLISNSWSLVRKYIITVVPCFTWITIDYLYSLKILTYNGFVLIFVTLLILTIFLAFSEFVSITSYLAIAEPKSFKWAQKFALKYALPEIQKKLDKFDMKEKK